MQNYSATLRNSLKLLGSCHHRTSWIPVRFRSWEPGHRAAPQGGPGVPNTLSKRQKRIIYRSSQRGWLELDVLLGRWAAAHVPQMHDEESLAGIEDILDAETPHVLQWVLGHASPPPHLDTTVMKSIQEYARGAPAEQAGRVIRRFCAWGSLVE